MIQQEQVQIKDAQQIEQFPGWYLQQDIEGNKEKYIFQNKDKYIQTYTHPKYLRDQDIQILINKQNKNIQSIQTTKGEKKLNQSQALSEQYQQNLSALAEDEEENKIEDQVLNNELLRQSQKMENNNMSINKLKNSQLKDEKQQQNVIQNLQDINQMIQIDIKNNNNDDKNIPEMDIESVKNQKAQNNNNNQQINNQQINKNQLQLITEEEYAKIHNNQLPNILTTNKPLFQNQIGLSILTGTFATICYIYGLLTIILNHGAQNTILAAFLYFFFEFYDYYSQLSILRVGKIIGYDYQEKDDIQEILNKIYEHGAINKQFQDTWNQYSKNVGILQPQNFKVENITKDLNAIIVKKKHLKIKFTISLEFDSENTQKEYIEYIKSDKNTKDQYQNLIKLSKFKKANKIQPYIKELQNSLYIVAARKGRRNNNIFKILTSPWILIFGLGLPVRILLAYISDYQTQEIKYKISKI